MYRTKTTYRTKVLLGLMLAGFMGTAAAAAVGPVGPGYLGDLSGRNISIGNTFAPGFSFNDVYTFDIGLESGAVGSAVSSYLDMPFFHGVEFAITNFGVAFKDSLDNTIVSDVPVNNLVSVFANLPAAMGYQFVVSGKATGTMGGGYGGVLAAAPVPEAETYAMLLAGLGLVGFMVSRRRNV